MTGKKFDLTEETLTVIEEIGGHMPGGLFIYQAAEPETLIYANQPVFDIYGCADLEEFRALTGFTFRGMVYPEDYARISASIVQQISSNEDHMDYAEYRITRRDGSIRWVDDYGHYSETEHYGGVYVVFISDITEKREREYRQHVAEAMANARNDFLANMSHDIRTPMNAIVGYTNIAKSRINEPEAVTDALEKIGSASHFLLSLINDILDISKIDSGKMQVNPGPCSLDDVFRRIEDITALQAKNKSLRITYRHESVRHPRVKADELRIEQVLVNIVGNAIKYTPAGKTVDLIAEEEPAGGNRYRYRFIVRDTGIGISEEYLPHIFESFTREEKTTVNRVQGTGLGLAISARVVELMGGTISVKSKPGEGSEFVVELELESLETDPDSPEAGEEKFNLSGCRVLIVEDNDINAEIAEMILTRYGIGTERAENGLAGLELVRSHPEDYYDAVLMDIQMPVMNGLDATREIRALADGAYSALPIIAMSANAFDEDVKGCLAAGMNAHIAKPFNPEDLLRLLQAWIRSAPQ